MAENNEIEDRVDFDDDNYSDEEEEAEEQIDEEEMEDEGSEDASDENGVEQSNDIRSGDHEEAMEAEKGDDGTESVEGEEKASAPISQEDAEKYAELLALPPHGSEIFVGGLSRDVTEEDLGDLCEPFGEIFEIRVMKNKETGESKGFAFVAFKTKDVAQKAIEELHNKDFKGKTLRCSLSETKYRLFIGNVPKSWTDDEFRKVVNETGPGAETIELIKDPLTPSRNRGFAFIEYYNNACADYSRQKMSAASFKFDGNSPTVTWADPKITPDHSAAASQVKALYVKNIPENTPTEQLKELFQRHGEVTKVVMPPAKSGGKRDFGFVHYADRSSALKAIKDAEKYEVDGQVLEVVLAKPQAERKLDTAAPQSSVPLPNFIPNPGYGGFPIHPYASAPALYGAATAGFQQPMIYGRGPMPTGMQMVPMMLPDGRIGYVLQQPGAQMPPASIRPQRNDWSNVKRGPRGRDDDAGRGRRYRPY
ncbi:hypothetical protein Leryth_002066 [Lithospermum erythrorhizon]|nr:hypothetical protein Leryth_002066 [Lithospermum erythrorhizon]